MVKMNPRSKDARNKFNECQKAVKRLAFEEAIATERTLPPSETVKIDDIGEAAAPRSRCVCRRRRLTRSPRRPPVVEETYDGPQLPSDGTVTMDFVRQLMEYQRAQKLLHRKHVMRILVTLVRRLKELPSLVDVAVPESNEDGEGGFITVCGDTHGQYYDLLNVFDMNGLPSEHNPYVFNGALHTHACLLMFIPMYTDMSSHRVASPQATTWTAARSRWKTCCCCSRSSWRCPATCT